MKLGDIIKITKIKINSYNNNLSYDMNIPHNLKYIYGTDIKKVDVGEKIPDP